MSLLLTLKRFHTLLWCFCCWLWTIKCQLGSYEYKKVPEIYESQREHISLNIWVSYFNKFFSRIYLITRLFNAYKSEISVFISFHVINFLFLLESNNLCFFNRDSFQPFSNESFKLSNILAKNSILDIWQVSEHASGSIFLEILLAKENCNLIGW